MSIGAAIPGIIGGIGSLLGGIGSGGNQGGRTTDTTQNSTSKINSLQQTIEPEYWTQFRKSIMTPFQQQLGEAQKPVYGNAQIADSLGKYNALYNSGVKGLRSNLARYGRQDSGALDMGASNLMSEKLAGQTGFMSQLPFMESQAKQSRMMQLLGLGANWSGAAPTSTQTTGTNTTDMTSRSAETLTGSPWWKNALFGLGGMMMSNPKTFGGQSWGQRDPSTGE